MFAFNSRAFAFRSLYYPWGKMGTTRSLENLENSLSVGNIYKQQWNKKGSRGFQGLSSQPLQIPFHDRLLVRRLHTRIFKIFL